MIRNYFRSVGRALVLTGLALAGLVDLVLILVAFCLLCVGLIFFIAPATEYSRRRAVTARRLVGRWSGIAVDAPYTPEPPEPVRERDGWYREGKSLYKKPRFVRLQRRIDWVFHDPATGRDLGWLVLNPLFSVVMVVAALLTGPAAVRLACSWNRRWLGPPSSASPRRKVRAYFDAVGFQPAMLAVSVLNLVMAVPAGLSLLVPPSAPTVVGWARHLTDMIRENVFEWTGIRIARPYRQAPAFPVPRADGLYQRGQQLYDTPWRPSLTDRYQWVSRDPATYRDVAAGLAMPVVFALLLVPSWGPIGVAAFWLPFTTLSWWVIAPVMLVCLVAGLVVAPPLLRWQAKFAKLLLGPTQGSRLARRVERVERTRTAANVEQAAELRRIERDLHDGVQSRLVAMGMKLGAVEALIDTDPVAAKRLAAELRESSATTLVELRQLVRGIHPPVLSERGLADAVRALAMDSPLKADVTIDVEGRADRPVEAGVYFAVSELLGNAVKHGHAGRAGVDLRYSDGELTVVVTDDGQGGAEPARGSGLRGIERRLAAFDGRLTVASPPGGPTKVTMEIPCLLDPEPLSPRTSISSATE